MDEIKERQVWVNGTFVPESEAKVSIYDSALMFGDMVFEMTRSFKKKQFKLRDHLARLYAGIKILRIPLEMTPDEMETHIEETIKINDPLFQANDEHRLMINVSRGALSIYQDVKNIPRRPYAIIADFPLRWTVASMGTLFETGINLAITAQRAIPASLLDPKIKNRSRLFYLMANIEVSNQKSSNTWALLLDPDGFIAEGTGDNFLMVKNGVIISPEGRNILRGISRAYVMNELASQLGLKSEERNIEPYDVWTADEAFITGTPFCILPVTSLNNIPIGVGTPGPITRRLLEKWSKNVDVDIEAQIKGWNAEPKGNTTKGPSPYSFL